MFNWTTDTITHFLSASAEYPIGNCGKCCCLLDISFVYLTRGLVSVIDKYDLWCARQYTWYANEKNNGCYAATRTGGVHTYLHRVLCGPPSDMLVDHIDGDTLNNRRENLRVVSKAENNANRHYC